MEFTFGLIEGFGRNSATWDVLEYALRMTPGICIALELLYYIIRKIHVSCLKLECNYQYIMQSASDCVTYVCIQVHEYG